MPASGEIVQVTFKFGLKNQLQENVLHFRQRTGLETTAQIAGSLKAYWLLYKPMVCNATTLFSMDWKIVTPIALDTVITIPDDGTQLGGVTSSPMANAMAAVFTLRTGQSGKSHRGRVYCVGFPQSLSSNDNNEISSAGATVCVTAWSNILAAFRASTGSDPYLALGIYSRKIGGTHPYTLAGWQAVENVVVRTVLGNQRRRRIGIGV